MKNLKQRPSRGFYDWVMTGEWGGGYENAGSAG